MTADDADFHGVPIAELESFFRFRVRFDEPSASPCFVNATREFVRRCHFHLPASDVCAIQRRAEKDAAVAIGRLFEINGQFKILILLFGRKITIGGVGAAFANEFAIFNVPFFGAVNFPASQIFAIKKGGSFVVGGSMLQCRGESEEQREEKSRRFHHAKSEPLLAGIVNRKHRRIREALGGTLSAGGFYLKMRLSWGGSGYCPPAVLGNDFWTSPYPSNPALRKSFPLAHSRAMKTSFVLLSFVSLSGSLLADDWAQFQGPTRAGISSETGLNLSNWKVDAPPVVWEKELNEGFGGAAIVGDEVFLVDRDLGERDKLLCLSLEDGSEKWSFRYDFAGKLPFPGSRGVPLVDDEAVYFISGFGQVFRINRTSHQQDWMVSIQDVYAATPPKWGWAQSVVKVGDILIVPAMAEGAGLIGLDAKSGKELWKTPGFGDSHSTPTVLTLHGVEQAVFVATKKEGELNLGTTISVEPKSGKVLWKTDAYFNKIPIPFPTKVTEELVFLTGGYGDGSCMVKVTKKGDDWKVEKVFALKEGTQIHPPFVIGDHLYLLANENDNHKGEARKTGGLMCLDFDGKTIWQTGDEPFMGRGNMILVDGHLLIQDGEVGYLRSVVPSPDGYKEVAMTDVFGKKTEVDDQIAKQAGKENLKMPDFKFWSPMALSNGRLVMRGQDKMKCLDLRK
jgi:outer membrane protein assembly factor BamB